MSEAQARDTEQVDDLSAADLLTLAKSRKSAEERAAADLLDLAARWADLHPPESIHDAATPPPTASRALSTRSPSPARARP